MKDQDEELSVMTPLLVHCALSASQPGLQQPPRCAGESRHLSLDTQATASHWFASCSTELIADGGLLTQTTSLSPPVLQQGREGEGVCLVTEQTRGRVEVEGPDTKEGGDFRQTCPPL